MVWELADDAPNVHATDVGIERTPVRPQSSSRSISATISTMRTAISLRCPAGPPTRRTARSASADHAAYDARTIR